MRKIKKAAALCMAGVMAASLAACSGGETAETTTAAVETTAAAEETSAEETTAAETEAESEAEEASGEAFDASAEHGPIFTDLAENSLATLPRSVSIPWRTEKMCWWALKWLPCMKWRIA